MGEGVIICDREDIRTVEAEEQLSFVFSVLESIGIPEEELLACTPEDDGLTVEKKILLRDLCKHFKITLLDDMDRGLKIYVEIAIEDSEKTQQMLVAEWKKPWFVLKIDSSSIDRTKRYYAELHTNWWIMQEDQNEQM